MSKKKGQAVEVEAEATESQVETNNTEVETTEAEAEPEEEINYHGNVVEVISRAGTERRGDLKLTPLEERIGRNVAVKISLAGGNDGEPVEAEAPRQVVIQALYENDFHRREITNMFEGFDPEVPYQIVFAATKNMENTHHKAGTTASPGTGTRRGKTYEVQLKGSESTETLSQAEYVRALAEGRVEGKEAMDRSQIAKEIGISYGTVYQATKEMEMPDGRKGRPKAEGGEEKPKKSKKSAKANAEAKAPKAKTEDLPADPADDDEDAGIDEELMP